LAINNLGTSVDEDGNTIVHIMAENLDLDALKQIMAKYPGALSYDIVNKPNKKLMLPIHKALESIEKQNLPDHSFITFLVETLKANPSIPDDQDRVIEQKKPQTLPYQKSYDQENMKKLNDTVIKNIIDLSKMVNTKVGQLKSHGPTVCKLPSLNYAREKSPNLYLQFIKKLTEYYVVKCKQSGGYSGKRKIKNYFSDAENFPESGSNDSFVSNKRKQLMENFSSYLTSQDRPRRDPKVTEAYNALVKKIMELLDVDEDTAKIYRLALKIDVRNKNPELKKRDNDALQVQEIEKITESKGKLKKVLDTIDIEGLKKNLIERREQREKEQKEREQKKGEQKKGEPKKGEPKKGNRETKPPIVEADTTEEKPKKKTKKANKEKVNGAKSRVAPNGYLESDEIIFSPNY